MTSRGDVESHRLHRREKRSIVELEFAHCGIRSWISVEHDQVDIRRSRGSYTPGRVPFLMGEVETSSAMRNCHDEYQVDCCDRVHGSGERPPRHAFESYLPAMGDDGPSDKGANHN
jgi:hypothetical protein